MRASGKRGPPMEPDIRSVSPPTTPRATQVALPTAPAASPCFVFHPGSVTINHNHYHGSRSSSRTPSLLRAPDSPGDEAAFTGDITQMLHGLQLYPAQTDPPSTQGLPPPPPLPPAVPIDSRPIMYAIGTIEEADDQIPEPGFFTDARVEGKREVVPVLDSNNISIRGIRLSQLATSPQHAIDLGRELEESSDNLAARGGVHPDYIIEPAAREAFAGELYKWQSHLATLSDALANTVTVICVGHPVIQAPETGRLDPRTDVQVKVYTPRAAQLDHDLKMPLEVVEAVFRHNIAAPHAAIFVPRKNSRQANPRANAISNGLVNHVPAHWFIPAQRALVDGMLSVEAAQQTQDDVMDVVEQRQVASVQLASARQAWIARDRQRRAPELQTFRVWLESHRIARGPARHVLEVVLDTSPAARPVDDWLAAFRDAGSMSARLAAEAVHSAVEACFSTTPRWPIE